MKSGYKLPEQASLAEEAERMLNIGDDRETVFAFLRAGGLGKLDCMRVLADVTGISLIEAKNIVQRSRAWQ